MLGTLKIQPLLGYPVWFAGFNEKGKPLFHNPKALFPDHLTPLEMTRKESERAAKKMKLSSSMMVSYWTWNQKN
jgi:hypothetical protein